MTASNRTPAAPSPTPRKSLTLLQMLALIAFGGLAASLALKQLVDSGTVMACPPLCDVKVRGGMGYVLR